MIKANRTLRKMVKPPAHLSMGVTGTLIKYEEDKDITPPDSPSTIYSETSHHSHHSHHSHSSHHTNNSHHSSRPTTHDSKVSQRSAAKEVLSPHSINSGSTGTHTPYSQSRPSTGYSSRSGRSDNKSKHSDWDIDEEALLRSVMERNKRQSSREFLGKGAAQAINGPLYGSEVCVDTMSNLQAQLVKEKQKRQLIETKMHVLLNELDDIKRTMHE